MKLRLACCLILGLPSLAAAAPPADPPAAHAPAHPVSRAGVRRVRTKRTNALLVYLLLLVSLQIFLLVVAVEGVMAHDATLARNAAVLSAVVFASTVGLWWFLRDD